MLILAEVAPLQVSRTVFIPPTLRPAALSVIGAGVGVGVGEPDWAQYLPPVFRQQHPPQTIISVPVQTAVWSSVAEGALVVLVAVQLSVMGLYLPPDNSYGGSQKRFVQPPQMIISPLIQTAVCQNLADGALVVLVAAQLSVLGLYLPPVLTGQHPPQTIMSLPVHTAV